MSTAEKVYNTVTSEEVRQLARRILSVPEYSAWQLGADKFNSETDSVILVGSDQRSVIALALCLLANVKDQAAEAAA